MMVYAEDSSGQLILTVCAGTRLCGHLVLMLCIRDFTETQPILQKTATPNGLPATLGKLRDVRPQKTGPNAY